MREALHGEVSFDPHKTECLIPIFWNFLRDIRVSDLRFSPTAECPLIHISCQARGRYKVV